MVATGVALQVLVDPFSRVPSIDAPAADPVPAFAVPLTKAYLQSIGGDVYTVGHSWQCRFRLRYYDGDGVLQPRTLAPLPLEFSYDLLFKVYDKASGSLLITRATGETIASTGHDEIQVENEADGRFVINFGAEDVPPAGIHRIVLDARLFVNSTRENLLAGDFEIAAKDADSVVWPPPPQPSWAIEPSWTGPLVSVDGVFGSVPDGDMELEYKLSTDMIRMKAPGSSTFGDWAGPVGSGENQMFMADGDNPGLFIAMTIDGDELTVDRGPSAAATATNPP